MSWALCMKRPGSASPLFGAWGEPTILRPRTPPHRMSSKAHAPPKAPPPNRQGSELVWQGIGMEGTSPSSTRVQTPRVLSNTRTGGTIGPWAERAADPPSEAGPGGDEPDETIAIGGARGERYHLTSIHPPTNSERRRPDKTHSEIFLLNKNRNRKHPCLSVVATPNLFMGGI